MMNQFLLQQQMSQADPLDDDVSLESKKRKAREEKDAEDKKNRGNYRCSRCNLPKKGHVCPYQPRFRRRDQSGEVTGPQIPVNEIATQVEMDAQMTVRMLNLQSQGYPESYVSNLGPYQMSTDLEATEPDKRYEGLHIAELPNLEDKPGASSRDEVPGSSNVAVGTEASTVSTASTSTSMDANKEAIEQNTNITDSNESEKVDEAQIAESTPVAMTE